eukprot:4746991-Amphidinium_carterae.1
MGLGCCSCSASDRGRAHCWGCAVSSVQDLCVCRCGTRVGVRFGESGMQQCGDWGAVRRCPWNCT